MGKHTDKLGSFDDFNAPWETESGSDAEIEKPKLKRLIFNLKLGEAKAQDAQDEAKEKIASAEKERDEAKEEVSKASPEESNRKIAKLEKERDDLKAERDTLVSEKEEANLRKEVLGDLPEKYAKYVHGKTQEELEKSLEEVKADFGLDDEGGNDDPDDDDQVRTRPRTNLRNGADPKPGQTGEKDYDFDKAADQILGNGPFG